MSLAPNSELEVLRLAPSAHSKLASSSSKPRPSSGPSTRSSDHPPGTKRINVSDPRTSEISSFGFADVSAALPPNTGPPGTVAVTGGSGSSSSSNNKNLSHVPCKFYRQGICQAGNSCPFSHNLDGTLAADKLPCKYFQKGNCKFGLKCALAHFLPDGTRVNSKGLLSSSGYNRRSSHHHNANSNSNSNSNNSNNSNNSTNAINSHSNGSSHSANTSHSNSSHSANSISPTHQNVNSVGVNANSLGAHSNGTLPQSQVQHSQTQSQTPTNHTPTHSNGNSTSGSSFFNTHPQGGYTPSSNPQSIDISFGSNGSQSFSPPGATANKQVANFIGIGSHQQQNQTPSRSSSLNSHESSNFYPSTNSNIFGPSVFSNSFSNTGIAGNSATAPTNSFSQPSLTNPPPTNQQWQRSYSTTTTSPITFSNPSSSNFNFHSNTQFIQSPPGTSTANTSGSYGNSKFSFASRQSSVLSSSSTQAPLTSPSYYYLNQDSSAIVDDDDSSNSGVDNEVFEEDYVPGSLSDIILTPQELLRRDSRSQSGTLLVRPNLSGLLDFREDEVNDESPQSQKAHIHSFTNDAFRKDKPVIGEHPDDVFLME